MPTYEYRCKRCGEGLEVVQSFTDDALTDCPACKAKGQLRKVFGSIGITFKGSGFYKTDSRNGSSSAKSSESKGEKGESSSGTTETKTSETKTETKSSETKAEPKPSSSGSSTSAA